MEAKQLGEFGEPWRVERTQEYPVVVDQEESTVAIPVGNLTEDRDYAIEETRLRRIVACVNAFAGVPTEQVERMSIGVNEDTPYMILPNSNLLPMMDDK